MESPHYPLLTYSWTTVFRENCKLGASFSPSLRLHNYISGERWVGLSSKDGLTSEVFERVICAGLVITGEERDNLQQLIREDFRVKFLIKNEEDEPGLPVTAPLGYYDPNSQVSYLYTSFLFNMTTHAGKLAIEQPINQVHVRPMKPLDL